MIMKKTCGIVYLNQNLDKILLVKNKNWFKNKFFWSIPKGGCEKIDQNIEDCALREFYEETGICVNLIGKKKIRLSFIIWDKIKLYLFVYIQNKLDRINNNITNLEEISEKKWIPVRNLKKLKNKNYTVRLINKYLPQIVRKITHNCKSKNLCRSKSYY